MNMDRTPPDHPDTYCPAPSGDWAEDNRIGREAAMRLVAHITEGDGPPLVAQVMRRMYAPENRQNGVQAGFSYALAAIMFAHQRRV